jgi:hypothetical protein
MDEKYSLNNLREIVPPDAPPLWPLATEAWLLLLMLASSAIILIYQRRQAKKRNAYRRAGLALLDGVSTVHDVSVVLKRVALAAYPREQVASLYGEDWEAFLRQTCHRRDYSLILRANSDDPASREVIQLAGSWIKHHRVVNPLTHAEES